MLTLAFEHELQVNINLDVANHQAPTYVWERQKRAATLRRYDKKYISRRVLGPIILI